MRRSGKRTAVRLSPLTVIAVAMAAGLGSFMFYGQGQTAKIQEDFASVCAENRTIKHVTMLTIDATDKFLPLHQQRLLSSIEEAAATIPIGGQFIISLMNADDPAQPLVLVSVCNPGNGAGASPLFINPALQAEVQLETFIEPVNAALQQLEDLPDARQSPILETVYWLTQRPDFDQRIAERRLFVVSDFLQYTPGVYSQLKPSADLMQAYQQSGLSKQYPLQLSNMEVVFDYLSRPEWSHIQGDKHRAFWQQLVTARQAASAVFVGYHMRNPQPVPGDTAPDTQLAVGG